MERRGKRRTRSQRIGEKGEALYKSWAADNGLTSQEVKQDYGIDFFSQVLTPLSEDLEEATGVVIAVQVRSIEGARRKRIKLDRTDAESALRLRIPYCLVAIDLADSKVLHRFLDESLLLELDRFLRSSQQTMTIPITGFSRGPDKFRSDLALSTEHGLQYRLRIMKAEREINADIPGAKLKFMQRSGLGIAAVSLPWITEAFAFDVGMQDKAAELVFERGMLPPPDDPLIKLKPFFRDVSEIASGPVLIGGLFEEQRTLFVEYQEARSTARFNLRRIGDERAYVGESGLILVISDPRNVAGLPVHSMSMRLSKVGAKPLMGCSASHEFLTLLKHEARLNEEGREGVPVSAWPGLDRIGPATEAILRVAKGIDFSLEDVFLADMADEEFANGISVLNAMIIGVGIERLVPGFLAGPAREQPYSDENWVPAGFRVPIVFNLKSNGVVVWVTGQGSIYIAGDPPVICGFRAELQESWEVKFQPDRFSIGADPVAWITEDWPGIPVMPPQEVFQNGLTFHAPIRNPLSGSVWPLRA